MDYLQYHSEMCRRNRAIRRSFKPYYKWITFNTLKLKGKIAEKGKTQVLNLIINGLPSRPLPKG